MKVGIYDALVAGPTDGDELIDEKAFRKSTRSILRGAFLIKKIIERNPFLKTLIESKRLGFIVGSSVGEIEVTREFLKELAVSQTARPFLFQLSSHNSTAGFLAQYFSLQGATMTVSNQYQSAEVAFENAALLISSQQADLVLVFCVDQVIDGWMDLNMYKKFPQLKEVSGASVLLIGNSNSAGDAKPVSVVRDFQYGRLSSDAPTAGDYYDSNTVEHMAQLVEKKATATYRAVRPDYSVTEFSIDVFS